MITSENFRELWLVGNDLGELVMFPQASLADTSIPDDSKAFLTSAGLPTSAPPFLSFSASEDGPLQTAASIWRLPNEFNRYRVIGSNSCDDPICIDESCDGQVVYLVHDDKFRRVLVNTSIPQLAETLLAFRHLVQETQRRNGEDAFLDGDVPSDLQQWLSNEIVRIDPSAANTGCFWSEELETLRANQQ